MGQPTNSLLQRIGRAQLWPRLGAVSSKSLAYADQQFKSQYSSRLLTLLFAYGMIIPIPQPWLFLYRNNKRAKPDYSLRIPLLNVISSDTVMLRNLYYSIGVWYEGRYVYYTDRPRRQLRYSGLHWGNVRIINISDKQLYLLRGLTTTFAIGAETDVEPVWKNNSPAQDAVQDETAALASWSRVAVGSWENARLDKDITLKLLSHNSPIMGIDTRVWL